MSLKQRVVSWLEAHRALVVVAFCLPASLLFGLVLRLRRAGARLGGGTHESRVRAVQRKVQEWNRLPAAERRLMCTARPNWMSLSTTFFQKHLHHQIPVPLYEILELSPGDMTVRVEPLCTVGDITAYLIPRGYSLAVTIELEDATLGGLALGTGMSTHSHKAGLFQECVVSYEVVLGDGSLVTASARERPELHRCLPWSHGSLGLLVALTLRIVPVKPYVRLKYTPVRGRGEYCARLRRLAGAEEATPAEHPDYLEGTIFSRDEAVIVTGAPSDLVPGLRVNRVAAWYKPWFYKHVESFLARGEGEELVPLRHYLLRHNRAIFWVLEDLIPFGNRWLFRALLGWALPPRPAFLKWTTTPGVRAYTFTRQVFQDVVLPMRELEAQVALAAELFDRWPLLVYGCRLPAAGAGQLRAAPARYRVPGTEYAMYNDLGVYGVPGAVRARRPYDPVAAMRRLEGWAREVGGCSFLYADIFMDRREFEQMFDLTEYEAARRRYHAEGAFPHLYDKVRPEIDVFAIGEENKILG